MLPMSLRSRLGSLLLTATAGCARGPTVSPAEGEVAAPASSSTAAVEESPPDPARAPEGDQPPPWWTPLPAVSLEPLAPADQQAVSQCAERYRIQAADVTADELFAAATCFSDLRAFGHEIRVHEYLLRQHPDTPHAPEVLVALGHRYEQIDMRPKAVAAYVQYLRTYAKRDDAQALGERAVCLARSLGETDTVDELLAQLERNYGRKGFVLPPPAAFEQLCAGLSPVPPSRP